MPNSILRIRYLMANCTNKLEAIDNAKELIALAYEQHVDNNYDRNMIDQQVKEQLQYISILRKEVKDIFNEILKLTN